MYMNKKTHKIFLIAGARPNFIKIAPIFHEFEKRQERFDVKIIHTGQHYDYAMSQVFFEQFGLPEPDFFLDVGSGSHGYQTANILLEIERLIISENPELVIVVGDVNSTLAAALAAVKLDIPIAHVEAGLRSFDVKMPEEINRILTDRISNLLFVSEPSGIENLKNEGIDNKKMHLVGNVMIDSLVFNLPRIMEISYFEKLDLEANKFGLVTLHRPSNVDSGESLKKVISILKLASENKTLLFPAHPRTMKNIDKFGLKKELDSIRNLIISEPIGYLDFMNLMVNSGIMITDSGGIQEETTYLGIPCITLRNSTERPITITHGTNEVTGLEIEKFRIALEHTAYFQKKCYQPPALWDGKASGRIVEIIGEFLN